MNKILFSLTIFSIAFGLFLFAAPNASIAASDNYNEVIIGSTNLFGVDEADNGLVALGYRDRDKAPVLEFQTYGLQGNWPAGEM